MRKRMEEPVLKSWDEADAALKEIAEAENQIAILESSLNIASNALKEEFKAKSEPYKAEIKKYEAMVKEFVTEHKADLKGKSRELTFGKVGFRLSTKVVLPKKLDRLIAALRRYEMDDCIQVEEKVNKDVLRTYGEKEIIAVGASLKKEDTFWYETKKDDSISREAVS